jgi:hypothetical protein
MMTYNHSFTPALKALCCVLLFATQQAYAGPFTQAANALNSTPIEPSAQLWVPIGVGDITTFIPIAHETPVAIRTLAGDDKDNNGVRDDAQNRIIARYPNQPDLRNRSLLMAKQLQQLLTGQANAHTTLSHVSRLDYCMRQYGAGKSDGMALVMPYVLNTYQRSKAYLLKAREAISQHGTPQIHRCQ